MERAEAKKVIYKEEIFYYLFFAVLMGAKGLGFSDGEKVFTLCTIAAGIFWILKIYYTNHTWKEFFVILGGLLLGVLIYISSGEKAAFAAMLVILGMKNIPIRRIMGVCLGVWGSTFVISLFLGLMKIREGVVVVHEKLGLGPIIRYSLGYTHPNVLHVSYLILVMLLLYTLKLHGKRLWLMLFALFVGNLYIFLYSISYTGIIVVSFYLALVLYFDIRKKVSKAEKALLQLIMPFCVIFPILGPLYMKGKWFNFFNKLLSTRFELVYNFFHDYQISLFGTETFAKEGARLTLDSSFAYMLMYYGIIAFVLFLTLYFFTIKDNMKKDNYDASAILLATSVAGVTEQYLFNMSFKNLIFFFWGEYLYTVVLKSNKNRWWNKEISFWGKRDAIAIQTPVFITKMKKLLTNTLNKKKLIIAAITFAAMLAGGFLGAVAVELPQSVVVEKWTTDYRGEGEKDIKEVQGLEEKLVIGDVRNQPLVYEFTGNCIKMEFVRNVTSCAVWAGGIACIAAISIFSLIEWKHRKRYDIMSER